MESRLPEHSIFYREEVLGDWVGTVAKGNLGGSPCLSLDGGFQFFCCQCSQGLPLALERLEAEPEQYADWCHDRREVQRKCAAREGNRGR